jgi:hypothetical protein
MTKTILVWAVRLKWVLVAVLMVVAVLWTVIIDSLSFLANVGLGSLNGLGGVPSELKTNLASNFVLVCKIGTIKYGLPIRNICQRLAYLIGLVAGRSVARLANALRSRKVAEAA